MACLLIIGCISTPPATFWLSTVCAAPNITSRMLISPASVCNWQSPGTHSSRIRQSTRRSVARISSELASRSLPEAESATATLIGWTSQWPSPIKPIRCPVRNSARSAVWYIRFLRGTIMRAQVDCPAACKQRMAFRKISDFPEPVLNSRHAIRRSMIALAAATCCASSSASINSCWNGTGSAIGRWSHSNSILLPSANVRSLGNNPSATANPLPYGLQNLTSPSQFASRELRFCSMRNCGC